MDILTHAMSGIAVSSVVVANTRIHLRSKFLLLFAGAIASTLPDIDVISLWSGFDSSIGKWFGLAQSGKVIYFSKFWYSHHAFMHSLAAALCFGFLLAACFHFVNKTRNLKISLMLLITFVLSYTAHLLGDIPTPASVWGGINLLWPSDNYIGGLGKIWWWNNYDIFLILFFVVIINTALIIMGSVKKIRAGWIPLIIFLAGLGFIFRQIETRPFDFSYAGHTVNYQSYEQKSLEIQEDILGKELFGMMKKIDDHLNFYF